LADVSFPILGIDFLRKQQLVVDVVGSSLIPRACAADAADGGAFTVYRHVPPLTPTTFSATSGAVSAPSRAGVGPPEAPLAGGGGGQSAATWADIVAEFPAVVQPFSVATSPSHGV
jgi:hypothetical protein